MPLYKRGLHAIVKKEKICQLIMDYFMKSEVTCLHCVAKKEKICQLIMDYFVKSEVTYVSMLLSRRKRFVN